MSASSLVSPDLFIYGATPGGIAMAVRAAREGLRVLLATREQHLGGMLTSGLGVEDTLYTGMAIEEVGQLPKQRPIPPEGIVTALPPTPPKSPRNSGYARMTRRPRL